MTIAQGFGILGINSDVAVGTYTAYTVPPASSARVRIFYRGVSGGSTTIAVNINGLQIFGSGAITSGNQFCTTVTSAHTNALVTAFNGIGDASTVAPYAHEYMLSAGDTVTYTLATTAATAMNFQVIGVQLASGV